MIWGSHWYIWIAVTKKQLLNEVAYKSFLKKYERLWLQSTVLKNTLDASLMEHVEYATRFRVQYFILHIRKYHLLLALLPSLITDCYI